MTLLLWGNYFKFYLNRLFVILVAGAIFFQANAEDIVQPGQPAHMSQPKHHTLLIMLHLPTPHFRPDVSYSGNYTNDANRTARHRIAEELARTHGLKLVENWPMPILNVDCYLMEENEDASEQSLIELLSKDPRVAWVQTVSNFDAQSSNDPLFPIQPATKYWHLDEVRKTATGSHVLVAVVDSGVEFNHPDLDGQISVKENFVDGTSYVGENHGTGVAGVIAARAGNGVGVEGVAPGTKIMALRACWQERQNKTRCNSFTLGKALNYAVTQGAQVINLSLSGPPDRLLKQLLDVAMTRNIKIVGAIDPTQADGGFPASYPGVFAVTDHTIKSFNGNFMIAPGRDIPTTAPGARWNLVSGSSYSAAHISGMMALLSELRPSASLEKIRANLVFYSVDPTIPSSRQIDFCATIDKFIHKCACACENPKHPVESVSVVSSP
ncbi:MAG: S8 family serine peptidase [Burkholderiales bacterium]|nr:S8 family serine peptidase [Burkholderiales bacterium]